MKNRLPRVATAVAVLVAVAGVPLVAHAGQWGATCYASKETTEYTFTGSIDSQPHHEHSFKTTEYTALFKAYDSQEPAAIPPLAKNDVYVELVDSSNDALISATHSPDDIRYFEVRTEDFFNALREGRFVFARFSAAFDRRNVGDEHCTERTVDFTTAGTQAEGDVSWVCDKAPEPCKLIRP